MTGQQEAGLVVTSTFQVFSWLPSDHRRLVSSRPWWKLLPGRKYECPAPGLLRPFPYPSAASLPHVRSYKVGAMQRPGFGDQGHAGLSRCSLPSRYDFNKQLTCLLPASEAILWWGRWSQVGLLPTEAPAASVSLKWLKAGRDPWRRGTYCCLQYQRSGSGPLLPALDQPRPGSCGHLGNEPIDRRSDSFSASPSFK